MQYPASLASGFRLRARSLAHDQRSSSKLNLKPFFHLLPYVAASFVFFLAFWGLIDMLSAHHVPLPGLALRVKRNINTEVPALTASVKEILRDRQTRLEREME